jgi:hypothetical protein
MRRNVRLECPSPSRATRISAPDEPMRSVRKRRRPSTGTSCSSPVSLTAPPATRRAGCHKTTAARPRLPMFCASPCRGFWEVRKRWDCAGDGRVDQRGMTPVQGARDRSRSGVPAP